MAKEPNFFFTENEFNVEITPSLTEGTKEKTYLLKKFIPNSILSDFYKLQNLLENAHQDVIQYVVGKSQNLNTIILKNDDITLQLTKNQEWANEIKSFCVLTIENSNLKVMLQIIKTLFIDISLYAPHFSKYINNNHKINEILALSESLVNKIKLLHNLFYEISILIKSTYVNSCQAFRSDNNEVKPALKKNYLILQEIWSDIFSAKTEKTLLDITGNDWNTNNHLIFQPILDSIINLKSFPLTLKLRYLTNEIELINKLEELFLILEIYHLTEQSQLLKALEQDPLKIFDPATIDTLKELKQKINIQLDQQIIDELIQLITKFSLTKEYKSEIMSKKENFPHADKKSYLETGVRISNDNFFSNKNPKNSEKEPSTEELEAEYNKWFN